MPPGVGATLSGMMDQLRRGATYLARRKSEDCEEAGPRPTREPVIILGRST
jgi:hypothetical protein